MVTRVTRGNLGYKDVTRVTANRLICPDWAKAKLKLSLIGIIIPLSKVKRDKNVQLYFFLISTNLTTTDDYYKLLLQTVIIIMTMMIITIIKNLKSLKKFNKKKH